MCSDFENEDWEMEESLQRTRQQVNFDDNLDENLLDFFLYNENDEDFDQHQYEL